ncbi:leucine-rich repeat, cysteine-containing subtype protein [Tanacetum coccineum]
MLHLLLSCEDLETLRREHWHVSKYCNQLRTFCLRYSYDTRVKDGIWLHQLALNSTVLERFHVTNMDIPNAEDLILIANNCCNSLISLKVGKCYLSKLGDAFRYAVRLEQFCSVYISDEESVLPLLNQIRKLKLGFVGLDEDQQCLLFERCPNLEVLYTRDECGDRGLHVIGKFCKKLRKLTHHGLVTHVGLIALAKGCTKLECLKVRLDISNEAMECVGTHLKNLRDFRIWLRKEDDITILPLDYGVKAMLMGCSKLERLDISLQHGGLTDVVLEDIGKYGVNLRSLRLECVGNSNAGLVKLSQGCQKLRELKLLGCPFSEQVVTSSVFNIRSLRKEQGQRKSPTSDEFYEER